MIKAIKPEPPEKHPTSSPNVGQVDAKMQGMNLDENRFCPFIGAEDTTTQNAYDHDTQYQQELNYYRHKTKGETLAYNSYCETHALEFFSDEEKTPLKGKYKVCLEDPQYAGVTIHSIQVGESELSFFAENKSSNTLTEGSNVSFELNAFVTEINTWDSSQPAGYGFIKLRHYNGQSVNQNEYQINGTIEKKVSSLQYNNCFFEKYLIEINNRGTIIKMPVLIRHYNNKNNKISFNRGDRVSFNVNLHGRFQSQ
ncbi:MAG: hypothetical protein RLZZ361_1001 [Cyanobacteriota bacterium]|jgi:hypothetical protein